MVIRVVKGKSKWFVVGGERGWNEISEHGLKANAVKSAFRYAKKRSPATVRIYSATGKMQVESEW